MPLPQESGCRRDVFDLIETLDCLTCPDAVVDAAQRALAEFGCETFLCAGLPNPDQRFEDVVMAKRWPRAWFEIYTRHQYVLVDPIVREARRTSRPYEWSEVSFDPDREPRAAELTRRRADFGFRRGFVVPIHGPGGYTGLVSMSGARFEPSADSKPGIHLLALYAFERVRELRAPRATEKPLLTIREREVLVRAAQGSTAWEIGDMLGISKRTVDEHSQSACRKLGAVNRTQAVAIALRDGLLEL